MHHTQYKLHPVKQVLMLQSYLFI
uniref:Uncharacterized protein n=1 Tax=Anguilla anguilla TaxID=7936 RepID=A0A0E9TX35_ANGAN